VAESADATVSKTVEVNSSCGFKSLLRHYIESLDVFQAYFVGALLSESFETNSPRRLSAEKFAMRGIRRSMFVASRAGPNNQ
jgi:hypothetical protein